MKKNGTLAPPIESSGNGGETPQRSQSPAFTDNFGHPIGDNQNSLAAGVPNYAAVAVCSCPNSKSGKCLVQKKQTIRKRTDFTAAQREKMMEEARKICKKRYGAPARVYKIDYAKWIVICTEPGFS